MRFNIHSAPALNMVLNKLIRIPVQACKALLTCLMFFPVYANAQAVNQVKIFPTASLYAHPNSNLNIFSDISHAGSLVSYDTSLINFYASVWLNENGNRLPDESASGIDGVGGIFTFSGLKLISQQIVTISPEPNNGFPNLRIDNLQNVSSCPCIHNICSIRLKLISHMLDLSNPSSLQVFSGSSLTG